MEVEPGRPCCCCCCYEVQTMIGSAASPCLSFYYGCRLSDQNTQAVESSPDFFPSIALLFMTTWRAFNMPVKPLSTRESAAAINAI